MRSLILGHLMQFVIFKMVVVVVSDNLIKYLSSRGMMEVNLNILVIKYEKVLGLIKLGLTY